MKQTTLILFTILALTLTACGAPASAVPVTASQTGSAAGNLSGPTLIILGSLKLDGTDQAITPQQAKDLLPLWQVYKEVSTSDTAAQAEVDALVKQIEETMTPEQMTTIQGMNITPQDSFAVMQQLGLGMGGGRQSGNSGNTSSSRQGNGGNFFVGPGGGVPPGAGGGGDRGGFTAQSTGGQGFSPEQMATAQASRSQRTGGNNFMISGLLDALIQYLQKLAGK
jgi:hypothetical protein